MEECVLSGSREKRSIDYVWQLLGILYPDWLNVVDVMDRKVLIRPPDDRRQKFLIVMWHTNLWLLFGMWMAGSAIKIPSCHILKTLVSLVGDMHCYVGNVRLAWGCRLCVCVCVFCVSCPSALYRWRCVSASGHITHNSTRFPPIPTIPSSPYT